jgi:hypothetical protein
MPASGDLYSQSFNIVTGSNSSGAIRVYDGPSGADAKDPSTYANVVFNSTISDHPRWARPFRKVTRQVYRSFREKIGFVMIDASTAYFDVT